MSNNLKIFNMQIRKALCFTLILLLSLSPYATAAATSPGCGNGSCMKSAIRADQAADQALAASKSTAMPFDCCSGMQGATCDFEKGQNFDIPDIIMSPVRPDFPDSPFFVAFAIDSLSNNPTQMGFGPHFKHRAPPLSVPIYLYNLALLC